MSGDNDGDLDLDEQVDQLDEQVDQLDEQADQLDEQVQPAEQKRRQRDRGMNIMVANISSSTSSSLEVLN